MLKKNGDKHASGVDIVCIPFLWSVIILTYDLRYAYTRLSGDAEIPDRSIDGKEGENTDLILCVRPVQDIRLR